VCIDSILGYLHLVLWNITKTARRKIKPEDTTIMFNEADRPKPVRASKTVLDIHTFQSADQLARLGIHTPILALEEVTGKIFQPETTGIQKLEIVLSPRNPSSAIRTFSSAVYFLRVARRMLRRVASIDLFCSAISAPYCCMVLHFMAEKCLLTFTLNVSHMF
jgi:hypothetical protein